MAAAGALSMAESYPASKVRGSGQEELPRIRGQGQQPGGATPHPRSRATTERGHPVSEARAETGRSNPTSKEWWLCGRRRA